MVYLRFGSLTEELPPVRAFREVHEISGLKLSTCTEIVRRWKRDGYEIRNNRYGCPSNRKLTPEIEQFVTSPKMLKEWHHLSLE